MKTQEPEENLIVNLTFKFAISVIDYAEQLLEEKRFVMANQLMKSGTSIGANVREAQNAESKADFIHKMKIALKEAREASYWLALTNEAGLSNDPSLPGLASEAHQILAILAQSVLTAKANANKPSF